MLSYIDKTMTAVVEEWIDSLSTKTLPAIHLNTEFKEFGVEMNRG